jgi:hypothetical protein
MLNSAETYSPIGQDTAGVPRDSTRGRRILKGAVIGAAVGAGVALVGWAVNLNFDDNSPPRSASELVRALPVGVGVGAVVGLIISSETGGPQRTNEAIVSPRLIYAWSGERMRVGLRLRF